MSGLIAQLLTWPTLGFALLVFGFAPGAALRLIVLFYRRDNPRRQELLGELYGVPRIDRPFWVFEQLEVAIFEGLRDRINVWLDRAVARMGRQLAEMEKFDEMIKLQRDAEKAASELKLAQIHNQASAQVAWPDDPFASLLADDIARGWRGRGWRGTPPKLQPKEDYDPPAPV